MESNSFEGVSLEIIVHGKVMLLDDNFDLSRIERSLWLNCGYAAFWSGPSAGRKRAFVHHLVLPRIASSDLMTDHANGDKLDNRLCNLRRATRSQNFLNVGLRKDNSSGYRGVYFNKKTKLFVAKAYFNGKSKYLGSFSTAKDAAIAYDKFMIALHGIEFFKPNFPQGEHDGKEQDSSKDEDKN